MSAKDVKKVSEAVHRQSEKAPRQVTFQARDGDGRTSIPDGDVGTEFSREMLAEQYPTAGLSLEDKRDAKYELIQELQQGGTTPGATPYGQVQWNDDVLAWMKKKQEVGIKAQFQEWFAHEFDKYGPVQKALARKLYPSFYRERVATNKLNLKLLEQLVNIRINGVQTKSDLFLQYAVQNGLIDMSSIENILHPEQAQQEDRQKFKRGLWNPRRLMNGDHGVNDVDVNAKAYDVKQPAGNWAPSRAPANRWNITGLGRNQDVTAQGFINSL